jgi:hypothetical protein
MSPWHYRKVSRLISARLLTPLLTPQTPFPHPCSHLCLPPCSHLLTPLLTPLLPTPPYPPTPVSRGKGRWKAPPLPQGEGGES